MSNFSLQYTWNQTLKSQERGNSHQLKQLLIVKEILLVSTLQKSIENSMEIMHSDGGPKGLTESMITEQTRQKALNQTNVIKD